MSSLSQWIKAHTPEEVLARLDRSENLRPGDVMVAELILDAPREVRSAAVDEILEGIIEHKAALRVALCDLIDARQRRAHMDGVHESTIQSLRNQLRSLRKEVAPDIEPMLAAARDGVRESMRVELANLARENAELKSKLAESAESKRRLREALARERDASKRVRT